MSLRAALGLLVGLVVIGFLLSRQDLHAIWLAILSAGWGLLPALAWRGASVLLAATAWRALFAGFRLGLDQARP
jgi:hypothetical protein